MNPAPTKKLLERKRHELHELHEFLQQETKGTKRWDQKAERGTRVPQKYGADEESLNHELTRINTNIGPDHVMTAISRWGPLLFIRVH